MPSTVLYLLNKTDGSNAFVIQPQTFDGAGGVQRHTDLTLYGNGAPNWGERFDDNFYHLLENFAVGEKPSTLFIPQDETTLGSGFGVNKPIPGQTWYNETRGQLFVYRGTPNGSQGWASATAALTAATLTPTSLNGIAFVPSVGDIVFDTTHSQLKVFDGTQWVSSAGNVVTSLTAGTGVSLSANTGDITISVSGIGTVSSVGIAGSTGLSVSGSPITDSGTITLTLGTELQGLSQLASTGMVTRLSAGSYAARAIVGGTGIVVSNPSGVTGNPTVAVGIIPIGNGGTGQTSAGAAFNALAPGGSLGTLLINNSAGYVGLAGGSEGQVLVAAPSSNPAFGAKWFGGSGSTFSHAANGYERLPSGLMIQWGSVFIGDVISPPHGTVNFSPPFNTLFQVFASASDATNIASGPTFVVGTNTQSNASFVWSAREIASQVQQATLRWFAIGI